MYKYSPSNSDHNNLYMVDIGQQEASFRIYSERKMGTRITLGNNPTITENGGEIVREITAYSAMYRKDDIVEFCAYQNNTRISGSQNDWDLLLMTDFADPQLYLSNGSELIFFPLENILVNTSDFVAIYYETKVHKGIVLFDCSKGEQKLFFEIRNDYCGSIYGWIINKLTITGMDIHALKELN